MELFSVDIRTVILLLAMGNLVAVTLLALYRYSLNQPFPHVLFLGARLAQTVAWVLLWLRGWIPDVFSAFLGNTLLYTGWALEALALLSIRQRQPALAVVYWVAAVLSLPVNIVLYGLASANLKIALASVVPLVLFILPALRLSFEKNASGLQRVVGLLYLVFSAATTVRSVAALTSTATFSLMTPATSQSLAFLALFWLMLFGAIGYVLLLKEQADRQLRESEARYKLMFESAPIAINITRGTTITDANPSYLKLFGLATLEELQRCAPLELFSPEVRVQIRENIERRAQGLPVPDAYEAECLCKDGTRFAALLYLTRATFADGPATMGFVVDVTERRRAEETLRTSEATLRAFINALPAPAFLLDRSGRFLAINAAMEKEDETLPPPLVGQLAFDLLPPALAQSRKAYFDQVIQTGTAVHFEDSSANAAFVNHMSPVVEPDGQVSKVAILVFDITGRKRAEEEIRRLNANLERRVAERTAELSARSIELRQANATLTAALQVKDEFLATMSHELRTPLTAVMGLAEALQLTIYGPLTEKQAKALQTIHASGQRLLNLLTDMLEFAQAEASPGPNPVDAVVVAEVCQACLKDAQPAALQKDLRLSLELDPGAKSLRVDGQRLRRMLAHLLANAVKFTPEGGAAGLTVSLGLSADPTPQPEMRFTVWDTGIGIAPADQEQLFLPFVQLDRRLARRYEGAGLGLALVQRLAKQYGGRVFVESPGLPGQGSRFTLCLPLVPPAARSDGGAE